MDNSSNNNKRSSLLYCTVLAALLVALDQFTKHLAVLHLMDQPPIVLIKGVFELTYATNKGAAFGVLQNRQGFFLLVTSLVLLVLVYFTLRLPETKRYLPLRLTACCLFAGALGNLIDRVRLGYVVDFFYFSLIDFPIFNVADCYVVVSSILLAVLILFVYKEEELAVLLPARKKNSDLQGGDEKDRK